MFTDSGRVGKQQLLQPGCCFSQQGHECLFVPEESGNPNVTNRRCWFSRLKQKSFLVRLQMSSSSESNRLFLSRFKGFFRFSSERRKFGVRTRALLTVRRSAAPCVRLPAAPPPSTSPPHLDAPHCESGRRQSEPVSVPVPPLGHRPASEEGDVLQEKEQTPQPAVVRRSADLNLGPAGPERSVSPGSLSDLSRPPSSLFSRSTDLSSGRSSILSGKPVL